QGAILLQVTGNGVLPDGLDQKLVASLRVPGIGCNRCGSFPLEAFVPAVVLLGDKAAIAPASPKAHRLPFEEDDMFFWIAPLEVIGATESGDPSPDDGDISLYRAGQGRIGGVVFR